MPTEYQTQQAVNRRMRILAVIDQELDKATSRFDRFNSPHEGWAVIREELDELWEHVRGDTGRGREAMVECVQIATMALRYVYDLGEEPLPEEEDALADYLERFQTGEIVTDAHGKQTAPLVVTLDGERYFSEALLVDALAAVYSGDSGGKVIVAKLCDGFLDKRGALLGRVREAVQHGV